MVELLPCLLCRVRAGSCCTQAWCLPHPRLVCTACQLSPPALAPPCRGEGLGGWEAACYLGAVGGLATELWKVVRGFIGGESG